MVAEGDVGGEMFFVRSGALRVTRLGLRVATLKGACALEACFGRAVVWDVLRLPVFPVVSHHPATHPIEFLPTTLTLPPAPSTHPHPPAAGDSFGELELLSAWPGRRAASVYAGLLSSTPDDGEGAEGGDAKLAEEEEVGGGGAGCCHLFALSKRALNRVLGQFPETLGPLRYARRETQEPGNTGEEPLHRCAPTEENLSLLHSPLCACCCAAL